jgi:hypothetical protein
MRARSANRLAPGLALAATAVGLIALLPVGGGCELVVSDTVPSFTCLPDAADTCPSGSVCVPDTHQCAPRSGTCAPGASTGCAPGMRCDTQTLQCVSSGSTAGDASDDGDATRTGMPDSARSAPDVEVADSEARDAPDGEGPDVGVPDAPPADAPSTCRGITCSCTGEGACDNGVCADQLTQTNALYAAAGSRAFCTQPCCTSADCPGNTVCFGTGGGGSYCVLPVWIGRSSQLGEGEGGSTCSTNSDCRSGLCSMNMCADTCCSTAQAASECASGTECRFAAFPGNDFDTHETAWCGPGVGNAAGGAICAVDTACQSGKCGSFGRCEAVCRNTADCGGGGLACSYGAAPTLPANKDIVAGCVTVTGMTANGGTCTGNTDCQSAFCDGTQCTDACVTDADCKSGLHCRPVHVQVQGSYSVLGCES